MLWEKVGANRGLLIVISEVEGTGHESSSPFRQFGPSVRHINSLYLVVSFPVSPFFALLVLS